MAWLGSFGASLVSWLRGMLDSAGTEPDPWEAGWQAAIAAAREALAESRGRITRVDIRGERWIRTNPARLLAFVDLARRAAVEHGINLDVHYEDGVPVLRVAARD